MKKLLYYIAHICSWVVLLYLLLQIVQMKRYSYAKELNIQFRQFFDIGLKSLEVEDVDLLSSLEGAVNRYTQYAPLLPYLKNKSEIKDSLLLTFSEKIPESKVAFKEYLKDAPPDFEVNGAPIYRHKEISELGLKADYEKLIEIEGFEKKSIHSSLLSLDLACVHNRHANQIVNKVGHTMLIFDKYNLIFQPKSKNVRVGELYEAEVYLVKEFDFYGRRHTLFGKNLEVKDGHGVFSFPCTKKGTFPLNYCIEYMGFDGTKLDTFSINGTSSYTVH